MYCDGVHDRDLVILLALLAAGGSGDRKDDGRGGFVSRMAARATGKVVDTVDPNAVLAKIDVEALMERVDVDALLQRVDVNALLDRIDINRLMARVDVEALADRVDVEALVARSGIPEIVKESTTVLAGSALDVVRRQLAAVDVVVGRAVYRLTGRSPSSRPDAPAELQAGEGITGHYAGAATRFLAFLADALIIWSVLSLTAFGVRFLFDFFTADGLTGTRWQIVIALVIIVAWPFLYFTFSLAVAGKTIGMGLVGLRVVTRSGSPLPARAAALRTLVFPFSFPFFGLGFIGILVGRERRALHDVAGGSAVVYDWGNRPAHLGAALQEWLDRRDHGGEEAA